MIITSVPRSDFEDIIHAATEFSRKVRSGGSSGNGIVLVDLMHNHATVLILNLLSALYTAQQTGADLVGLTAQRFIGHKVPAEPVHRLASAFGVGAVVVLDAPDMMDISPTVRRVLEEAETALDNWALLQDEPLRRAILATTLGGCPIGDLVYDSYLYENTEASIRQPNDVLSGMLRRGALILGRMQDLLMDHSVSSLLISHTVYMEYGIPTRAALQANTTVYGKIGLDPIGIRRYRNLEDAAIFPGNAAVFDIEYYKYLFSDRFDHLVESFFPPNPEKNDGSDFYRYGYGADKREESREYLLQFLGLDPEKKTAIIMAHQFTDACHCYPDSLYEDYYVWLDETLRIAADVQNINWLLRQHPYERMIGQGRHFNELAEKYRTAGNIHIVPLDITTSSLFACVDVLVTVNGTAGLEFASVGVPCILAGNPFYAGFGFTNRPSSRTAYEEALRQADQAIRLDAAAIIRAKEVAFVSYRCMRLSSSYVPYAQDIEGRNLSEEEIDRYWQEIAERLHRLPFREDPLYHGVRTLHTQDHPTMLNPRAAQFEIVSQGMA